MIIRRVRARSRWTLLSIVAVLFALGVPLAATHAASPNAGTVSGSNVSVAWTGAFMVPNPLGCDGPNDSACDNYKLTIQPPGYGFVVQVKLMPAADWDLNVYAPNGALAGSSGNGPGQLEVVTLANPPAGTYTVTGVPFAPAVGADGNSYTASATILRADATSQPPSGSEAITYSNHPAPEGLGGDAGEPSLGANPKSGNVMFQAALQTLRVRFDDARSPGAATWTDVTAPNTSVTSLDPIGFMDQRTGRWFSSQLSGTTSLAALTDDDGGLWVPSEGGPLNGGVDHQTIGGGPFAGPLKRDPNGPLYPDAIYYCSQDTVAALCARSDTGGLTFAPAVPIYTDECGGLHGHVKVAPDGTVYVPNRNCQGVQGVVVSEDSGVHWRISKVPGTTNGAWDPSVGIASDGTVYFGYDDGDGHPKVAVSHDRGKTWSNVRDVGLPFKIGNSAFPAMVAGDANRAALAFLGTTESSLGAFGDDPNWPGVWHLYVATTYDGGNTWTTVDATPFDPVQKGTICAGGFLGCDNGSRNLLDFMDASVDKEGRVLVGYADGCVGACVTGGGSSFTKLATIARQVNGKRLFAAYDKNTVPAAPNLSGKAYAGSPPENVLTWAEPYNGGSAITGYRLYRKTGSTGYALLATAAASARQYTDTQLTAGQTYTYKLAAVNANGEGLASNEVTPTPPALSFGDACTEPGIQVLTDGSNDVGWTKDPAYDLHWLSLAEPRTLGAGKFEFLLKVATLEKVPPNSTWDVIFKTADGKDHFVKMETDVAGAVTFGYGDDISPTDPTTTVHPADSGSRFTTDGTIRIVLARSALGINVGDNLTAFNAEARIRGVAADPLPDAMPAQDVRQGSYSVKGAENCSVPQADLAVTGSDITVSGLKGQGNEQVVVAIVHNLGNATATGVKVRIMVDGNQLGNVQTIGSIAPGSTGRASVGWDTHAQNGSHTLTAAADPANAIAESKEDNNSGSRTVSVQGSKVG